MNLDGSGRQTLITVSSGHFFGLIVVDDELLVSDWNTQYVNVMKLVQLKMRLVFCCSGHIIEKHTPTNVPVNFFSNIYSIPVTGSGSLTPVNSSPLSSRPSGIAALCTQTETTREQEEYTTGSYGNGSTSLKPIVARRLSERCDVIYLTSKFK